MKIAFMIAWILSDALAIFTIVSTMMSNDSKALLGYFFGAVIMLPCIFVTLSLNWGAGFAAWNTAVYVPMVLLMLMGFGLMIR